MIGGLDLEGALCKAGYRIDSVIGRGGMGTVYRATQLSLQRDVALKVVPPQETGGETFREQFLRESRLAASLEHPHVVPVYDAGESDGFLYLAMRYVPGNDLQAMIAREERLAPHLAVGIVEQLAGALDAAHTRRLVHGDVKPGNVLIGGGERAAGALHVLLGDFGLSRRLGEGGDPPTGRPMGSIHYVAPEQIRGQSVDARTDVYGLGCLLYQCLTGTVPFSGDTEVAVLYAHLEGPVPLMRDRGLELPAALDEVIGAALAKSPTDRPASAGELARAASRALAGKSGALERRSLGPRAASRAPATGRMMVGRLAESETLLAALEDATSGGGSLALIGGEPGIGKTTLARWLSELAEHRGIPSAWGVGVGAEAAPAYWHWAQVIRDLAGRREHRELLDSLGPSAAWLRTIVPDLDPEVPEREATTSDEGRFLTYDALLRLLGAAAERSGLLIVFDDLHLADEATLLALSFVTRSIADKPIMILGTLREVEAEHSRHGATPFGELIRPTHRVALRGLVPGDVRRLIEVRRVEPVSDRFAARLHELTGGNPLFISELLSLLDADSVLEDVENLGRASPLPTGVRDAIMGRVGLLSPLAGELLDVASVIGLRFRSRILAGAGSVGGAAMLELLDEAVRAGLLRPLVDPADGYAFAHGLVQATVYNSIPRETRLLLHGRVARALERSVDAAAGENLTEIAHHYLEAAEADAKLAVEYARRAGDQAIGMFAYDQAVTLYSRALDLCEPAASERLSLLQALGEAQMRAGDTADARATLTRAAETARSRGDPAAFARAALACGIWGLTAGVDAELIALAESAVEQLEGSGERLLLAAVKGFLAATLHWRDQVERRVGLADEAVALARSEAARLGTPEAAHTLAYVLGRSLLARWGPRSAEDDVVRSEELLQKSVSLGDGELELLVRQWRVTVLSERGRFAAVDDEIARVDHMANQLRQPRAMIFLPLHHAIRAACAGRFAEAERHNAESAEVAGRVRGSVGQLSGATQLLMIRMQQGRLPECEPILRATVAAQPEMVGFRSLLAVMLVQDGRPDEAQEELERVTERGLPGFPRDSAHITMLALTAEVATELGDGTTAPMLYEWMKPYSGRWTVSPGAAVLWPVDRSLGRLATVAGWYDRALEHLAAARSQSEQARVVPCIAITALDEARALLGRGRSGDHAAIRALTTSARNLAQDMGMGQVVDVATLVEAELDGAAELGADGEHGPR